MLFVFFSSRKHSRILADRIIYANPCKQSSSIRYADEVGVETMTFDNEQELFKIKQYHTNAK